MRNEPPLAELGHFVVSFQAVESAMARLIADISGPDPEYIGALTAELEFSSKARALDVIFTRFAQIHGLSQRSPHPAFHRLVNRILALASRRNEIVHSFYSTLITTDGQVAITRKPTRLKPSEGVRQQPHEDIMHGHLKAEVHEIQGLLNELASFRQQVIEALHPIKP